MSEVPPTAMFTFREGLLTVTDGPGYEWVIDGWGRVFSNMHSFERH